MNIEEKIDDNECVICFEDISSNNFIYFDCCKKKFHKYCLDNWINVNKGKNNNLNKCIYCRQKSTIMDKLIKNNKQHNIIIEIPTIIITRNIFNDRRLRLKCLYTMLIITLTILIILLVSLFLTIDIIH